MEPIAVRRARSRRTALLVLCGGALMTILDQTIVNVSLRSIQTDLGFSPAGLAWVVNAYLIAFGGLLLLAGRLGDLAGRKRVFITGLSVFTLASLLCGLAQSQTMLIAARFLQGAGGALTMSVVLGMIVTLFPEPGEQARAIGMFSFVASAGGAIGLLAGGVLTEAVNWHWIFMVNMPIGVTAGLLGWRILPTESGLGFRRGADIAGAALVTAALMTSVYTIVEAQHYGWNSAHTYGFGLAGLALLALFVGRQATAPAPLMPLRLFRSRNVSGANAVHLVMVAALFTFFFLTSLYLQKVLGYSPLMTGVAFLPTTAAIGTFSLGFSARLNTRFGARRVLLASLGSVLAGMLLLARLPVHGQYLVDLLPVLLLLGLGGGLAIPALMGLAMSSATPADAGITSGLITTAEQVGGALGLAVAATLSAGRTARLIAHGNATTAALTSGYHLAFTVAAGLIAAAIVLSAFALRQTSPAADASMEAGFVQAEAA